MVFVWRSLGGWSGCRFHLGTNKDVSDAEVFAICQAQLWIEGLQGAGGHFTIFADSTAAIERVRTDTLGPTHCLAAAAIVVCDSIPSPGSQVTIRRVPSHIGVEGSDTANRYAKAAADRLGPCQDEATPEERLKEASRSYMTCTATETRSRATAELNTSNVRAERRYNPPPRGRLTT